MPVPITVVDTETTGLHKGRLTWEVGMIRRDETGRRELSFFVEVDLSAAELIGLHIGRFYERHPLGRKIAGENIDGSFLKTPFLKTREQAAHIVAQWTHGAHVIGAIPSYDTETDLDRMLREAGLIPSWHHHIIDVEALTVGYLRGIAKAEGTNFPQIPLPWKSDELTRMLGLAPVPENERHTALGDCRWAERMYDKVMGQ